MLLSSRYRLIPHQGTWMSVEESLYQKFLQMDCSQLATYIVDPDIKKRAIALLRLKHLKGSLNAKNGND